VEVENFSDPNNILRKEQLNEVKEAVIPKGTKDVTTRHGSTIHYS